MRLNFCAQVSNYLGSTAGAVDFFELVNLGAQYAQALSLELGQTKAVEGMKALSSDGSSLLAWPGVFVEAQKFGVCVANLSAAYSLPNESAKREAQIQQAFDSTLIQGADFVFKGSKGVLHLHRRSWIDLGRALPFVEGVYNVSSLYSDFADLDVQIGKMRTEEDIWFPLLNLIKDIASIALSIFELIALALQTCLGIAFVCTPLTLGLSTIYLSAKISSVFYYRMVVEGAA